MAILGLEPKSVCSQTLSSSQSLPCLFLMCSLWLRFCRTPGKSLPVIRELWAKVGMRTMVLTFEIHVIGLNITLFYFWITSHIWCNHCKLDNIPLECSLHTDSFGSFALWFSWCLEQCLLHSRWLANEMPPYGRHIINTVEKLNMLRKCFRLQGTWGGGSRFYNFTWLWW